ncbi:MAG: hypothetical protein AAF703_08225 [Cyanobacteria bacterium P01_D01_bin.105]
MLKRTISTEIRKNYLPFSEMGLTLIECLVAIIVIALTTATIAPVMLFTVATRIQNQKVEQALQLAQGEIDKVRLTVEQGGDYGDRLQELSVIASTASTAVVIPAPTAFVANASTSVNAVTDARRIDLDGDGDTDFAVQLFRTTGIEVAAEATGAASTPVAFEVGARVYDARAEDNLGALLSDEASLTFTSGDGQRSSRPLAVLYSQITQGDREGALCQYWEYTGSTPTSLLCN